MKIEQVIQSDDAEQAPYTDEELAEMESAFGSLDHKWCYCQNRPMSEGGCIYCHEDK